jgi:hypothetical protein
MENVVDALINNAATATFREKYIKPIKDFATGQFIMKNNYKE